MTSLLPVMESSNIGVVPVGITIRDSLVPNPLRTLYLAPIIRFVKIACPSRLLSTVLGAESIAIPKEGGTYSQIRVIGTPAVSTPDRLYVLIYPVLVSSVAVIKSLVNITTESISVAPLTRIS